MPVFNTIFFIILFSTLFFFLFDSCLSLKNLKFKKELVPEDVFNFFGKEKIEKAQKYHRVTTSFSVFQSVFSLLLFLSLWLGGFFSWLYEFVSTYEFSFYVEALVYVGAFSFLMFLFSLPFGLWSTFKIEESFGFNKTTLKTYFLDILKGMLLGVLLGAPVFCALLFFFEKFSTSAWIYASVFFILFSLLMTYLAPSYIMPLFNKFSPLEEGELKSKIENLAKKCSFPLAGLFVIDGSKRSSKANAFFTGFGKNKRIALFDTLIEKQSSEELEAILAHEIGHYQLKHIHKMIVISFLSTVAMFFIMNKFLFSEELYTAFGINGAKPLYCGFIFFSFLFKPLSWVTGLLSTLLSRKHEFEADAYAKKHSNGKSLVSALLKLSKENLSHMTPDPLYVFFNYSHPPVLERIKKLEE